MQNYFRCVRHLRNAQLDVVSTFPRRSMSTEALSENYSESNAPRNHYEDIENQKKFLDYAARKLNIKDPSDWYNITTTQFREIGGSGLLKKYNYTLSLLLTTILSDYHWLPWKFHTVPKHYWDHPDNQLRFLQWAAQEFKINDMSDWYKIKATDFCDIGGRSLLKEYKGSPSLLLSKTFPNYNWLPWKFTGCPHGYWENKSNEKKFMEWVSNELGIKEEKDWYNVTVKELIKAGGGGIVDKYKGSLYGVLSSVYSEYDWLPWKFTSCPQNYWNDVKNQRKFLDWAGKELGIKDMSDWYKVGQKDIYALGGGALCGKYSNSVTVLLSKVYPEYDWLPWKFAFTQKRYWDDEKNVKKFIDWVGKELSIKDINDWRGVTSKKLAELGCPSFMSLSQMLEIAFPGNTVTKQTVYKKTQTLLKSLLKTIFPHQDVLEEYRHPDLVLPTGDFLELDYFYPQYNLAFEYQGRQHYKNVSFFHKFSSLEEDQKRDFKKVEFCKQKGITVIEVPYWWDNSISSLEATIYSHRPDLFTHVPNGVPVPMTKPTTLTKNSKKGLMTATLWDFETMEPNGWWMSEKFDGMRLFWNESNFYTRQGTKVQVPQLISSQLPPISLDGELWTQYGLYQDAVAMVQKKPDEEKWKKALYWVFDVPSMSNKPFEERIEYLKELKERGHLPDFVRIVEMKQCNGKEHLKEYFNQIIAKGGEGVMLREPLSLYKAGRSESLRKYKPFFDTEVKVLENNYPHGFNCLQMNGKGIFVGLSDNHDEAKKVKDGAVITVKYGGANVYGTLQYPKFYRERTDVKWEDLIKT